VSNQLSISSAENILARKGKSFYWARCLLGKVYSRRATRLYRLCRYVDDLADENHSTEFCSKHLLAARAAFVSGSSSNEVLLDGLLLIEECRIDNNIILDLIAGVTSDTQVVRLENFESLIAYCYQVAGTVGLMMCKALDTHEEAAYPFAIDLGIAMQLTNICRDVRTDAIVDRRYIPAMLVSNLAPSALIEPSRLDQPVIKSALASLLHCAEQYYASGERGLSYLPIETRLSILVAARVYREIGRQLKKRDYEYWHKRIVVSPARKALITLQCIASILTNPKFWKRAKPTTEASLRTFSTTRAPGSDF
jgi:15-cis-phytoene synthase